jgi:aminopeptidase N
MKIKLWLAFLIPALNVLGQKTSQTLAFDLLHTELHIKPNWNNQTLGARAILTLKPFFYDQDTLDLDAQGFNIERVKLNQKTVSYSYDNRRLKIPLPKVATAADTLKLEVVYIAQPNLLKNEGSQAITSSKGLYFINPLNEATGIPRQLWTQGETQANSAWFPTFDTPNQNHSQDIYITVEPAYTTLSNGVLKDSKINADLSKTDHWQQTKPHAVYLTMIAAGEFKKVIDSTFNRLEVSYYLEPKFAPYALDIFGRTPSMISYFENLLGVKYPWQKYAQIPVRKYVSGAMENTTATVHGKTVLKNKQQLIDGNDDGVIAHELFHHWFGNLVTCESWSHLPLNESFANYSEFLWASHYGGKEEGDMVYINALQDYLYEATQKQVPMIRFDYQNREDMFDAHSYQKGGRILHQLRMEVGDRAFFAALKAYLTQYKGQTAEIEDLRLVFEKTTGKDLKWFFNQWFLQPGHPRLQMQHQVKEGKIGIQITQTLDSSNAFLYNLKLPIVLYTESTKIEKELEINKESQSFEFDFSGEFKTLVANPDGYFLGTIAHEKTESENMLQYQLSPQVYARLVALETLSADLSTDELSKKTLQNPQVRALVRMALHDKFWRIRQIATQKFFDYDGEDFLSIERELQGLIANDPKSAVRADAILAIKNFLNPQNNILFRKALTDSSYLVNAAALEALLINNVADIDSLMAQFSDVEDINIWASVANFYATKGETRHYDWFINRLQELEGYEIYQNIGIFGAYLVKSTPDVQNRAIPFLKKLAIEESEWYVRVSAAQVLQLLAEDNILAKAAFKETINKETDERLVKYYEQFKN